MKGIIYIATNSTNGKSYIGQTVSSLAERKSKHLYESKIRNRKTHFYNALRKQEFEWSVLEEVESSELNTAEVFWISYFKYISAELYNLTNGGDCHMRGFKHSEETKSKRRGKKLSEATRKRISEAQIGKRLSNETKKKISESGKGKQLSEEHKQKLIKINTGKKASDETRRKLSDSHKGKVYSIETRNKMSLGHSRNRIVSFIHDDGTIYMNVVNLSEFARQHGLHVSGLNKLARFKLKSYRKYRLLQ